MDILHLAAPCRNVPVTFTLDISMKRLLVTGLLLAQVGGTVFAQTSLAEELESTKTCDRSQCSFRAGRDLRFTITGIGDSNGGVVFDRSLSDGDYYASLGLRHGCIIVHNGAAKPPILTQVAFVHPRTAKVYNSWQACMGGGERPGG